MLLRFLKRFLFGHDIFISYSRKDSLDYAYAIAEHFLEKGYDCYIDQLSSISPGQKLPDNIRHAIKRSSSLVIVGSEGAQQSYPITEEIDTFLKYARNRPIIPVNVADAVFGAIWYDKIQGLALIGEGKTQLAAKQPSQPVLARIQNSLAFTQKSKKMRRTAYLVATLTAILMGIAGWFWTIAGTAQQDASNAKVARDSAYTAQGIAEAKTKAANDSMRSAQQRMILANKKADTAEKQRLLADQAREWATVQLKLSIKQQQQADRAKGMALVAQKEAENKTVLLQHKNNISVLNNNAAKALSNKYYNNAIASALEAYQQEKENQMEEGSAYTLVNILNTHTPLLHQLKPEYLDSMSVFRAFSLGIPGQVVILCQKEQNYQRVQRILLYDYIRQKVIKKTEGDYVYLMRDSSHFFLTPLSSDQSGMQNVRFDAMLNQSGDHSGPGRAQGNILFRTSTHHSGDYLIRDNNITFLENGSFKTLKLPGIYRRLPQLAVNRDHSTFIFYNSKKIMLYHRDGDQLVPDKRAEVTTQKLKQIFFSDSQTILVFQDDESFLTNINTIRAVDRNEYYLRQYRVPYRGRQNFWSGEGGGVPDDEWSLCLPGNGRYLILNDDNNVDYFEKTGQQATIPGIIPVSHYGPANRIAYDERLEHVIKYNSTGQFEYNHIAQERQKNESLFDYLADDRTPNEFRYDSTMLSGITYYMTESPEGRTVVRTEQNLFYEREDPGIHFRFFEGKPWIYGINKTRSAVSFVNYTTDESFDIDLNTGNLDKVYCDGEYIRFGNSGIKLYSPFISDERLAYLLENYIPRDGQ